jgi:hypothetical protein
MVLSHLGGGRRRTEAVARLRKAVFALPVATRASMLEGIRGHRIIVGDYTSRDGGICPMLAAHRCGTGSDFRDFARAWDALGSRRRARPATPRELDVLSALLQESVEGSAGPDNGKGEARTPDPTPEGRVIAKVE